MQSLNLISVSEWGLCDCVIDNLGRNALSGDWLSDWLAGWKKGREVSRLGWFFVP